MRGMAATVANAACCVRVRKIGAGARIGMSARLPTPVSRRKVPTVKEAVGEKHMTVDGGGKQDKQNTIVKWYAAGTEDYGEAVFDAIPFVDTCLNANVAAA